MPTDSQRKKICVDWAHFNCHFGDGCRFSHDGAGGASQRGSARGPHNRWLGAAEASVKAMQRDHEHARPGGKGSATAGEARHNIYEALSSMGAAVRLPKNLKPCPYWAQFRCNFGASCGFSHDGPRGQGGVGNVEASQDNDPYDSSKLMESARAQMQAAVMLQAQAEGDAAAPMDPTAAMYQQFFMSQAQMATSMEPKPAAFALAPPAGCGAGMTDLMSMFAFDTGAPPVAAARQDPPKVLDLGLDDLTSMFSFSATGEPDKEPTKTMENPPEMGMPGFMPGFLPGAMPVPSAGFPMQEFGATYGSQGFLDISKGCGKGCWQDHGRGGQGQQDFGQPLANDESWRQSGLQLSFNATQKPGLSLSIPSLGMETTIASGGPCGPSFLTAPQGAGGMLAPDGSWSGQKRPAEESWTDVGSWNDSWKDRNNGGTSPPPQKQPAQNNWADQYNNLNRPDRDSGYCNLWQTKGCSRGDACRFSHNCAGGPAPNVWKQDEQSLAPSLMQMAETSLQQDAIRRSGTAPSSMSDLPLFLG